MHTNGAEQSAEGAALCPVWSVFMGCPDEPGNDGCGWVISKPSLPGLSGSDGFE
jgi:hypothetical protein